ncbi:hypothetical protein [Pseudoalteromonas ruthenica]|uniref:hypothetical protein n=1 Tax=Pseudoalteromonas ruthenica TaxID=151081 RepID=UPI0003B7906A|nr:hypothetical protein [Pseudoalteromonas ruthenica]
MNKKLIASVVLNLLLVAVILKGTFEPKDQKVFIATKDQVACLDNWKKKTYAKQQIWGLEYFDDHTMWCSMTRLKERALLNLKFFFGGV